MERSSQLIEWELWESLKQLSSEEKGKLRGFVFFSPAFPFQVARTHAPTLPTSQLQVSPLSPPPRTVSKSRKQLGQIPKNTTLMPTQARNPSVQMRVNDEDERPFKPGW